MNRVLALTFITTLSALNASTPSASDPCASDPYPCASVPSASDPIDLGKTEISVINPTDPTITVTNVSSLNPETPSLLEDLGIKLPLKTD
ncbi:MAG: hypothetical protein KBD31_04960 [Proteobacteria bacterium]|nr:hypothetical protein [Pseudomonadota bacterium]